MLIQPGVLGEQGIMGVAQSRLVIAMMLRHNTPPALARSTKHLGMEVLQLAIEIARREIIRWRWDIVLRRQGITPLPMGVDAMRQGANLWLWAGGAELPTTRQGGGKSQWETGVMPKVHNL